MDLSRFVMLTISGTALRTFLQLGRDVQGEFQIDRRGGRVIIDGGTAELMAQERWLRIIPVALIMYTISYVDRTNIALALDPKLSSMMGDLGMDDAIKGNAA